MGLAKTSRMLKNGISELLAIVLGIAITIAIGVMFYMFMPNFVNTMVQQQRIGTTILSTSVLDEHSAVITVSIKNLGTKAIKGLNISSALGQYEVKLLPQSNLDLSNLSLLPGQEITIALRLTKTDGGIIVSGEKVALIVTARFADNSIASATATAVIM